MTSHTASGVVTIYNYDENGNTISTYVGGNFAGGYTYDLFNRQKTYTPDGTVFTTTTYRPDGMRHSIGNTKHIWDAGNIVGDLTGSTYKQYFRALNLIYSLIGTTKQYYRYNGHGDVVALTNATGTVTKTYTYNAFGEEQNINATDANPFRYCGEYFDKVSGTLYLRARNYNASIGRFTQEDPIRHGGNWYSYCSGNPINCFDPTGLFNWGKLLQGVIAVTVGVVALVASIATLCAATPLVAVALMGIACAGTVSAYCGLYDIQEAETGENKLKDEMNDMLGDRAYELIESVAVGTSTFGVGLILSNPQLYSGNNEQVYYDSSSNGYYDGEYDVVNNYDLPDNVYHYMLSNNIDIDDNLATFEGLPQLYILEQDITVYRYWGGESSEFGHWVSPVDYGSNVRDMLSLPSGNTAEFMTEFVIPKGTTVLTGIASAIFENTTGGGIQWWVPYVGK